MKASTRKLVSRLEFASGAVAMRYEPEGSHPDNAGPWPASLGCTTDLPTPAGNPTLNVVAIGRQRSVIASLIAARSGSIGLPKPRQGVVANTPNAFQNGAVGFIDWLGMCKGIECSFLREHVFGNFMSKKP
jgi:hypothetical protein